MAKKVQENIILKIKTSRKSYFLFYLMVLVVGGLIFLLYNKGYQINNIAIGIFILFVIVVLNLTETHRMSTSYFVTPNDVTCIYGLFNKKTIKVDYGAISNMVIDQGFWQWILGYGTVDIQLFSSDNTFPIKNINKPSKFLQLVENIKGGKNE